MSFNRAEQFLANLGAIEIAFQLSREARVASQMEREILDEYSGFGGFKEVLYRPDDDAPWTASNAKLRPLVQKLYDLLDHYAPDEKKAYMDSVKNSVLTSFYTPKAIVDAMASSLKEADIPITSVLDPSAGNGQFIKSLRSYHSPTEGLMYEKDLITGLILAAQTTDRVKIEGFENISQASRNRFDLVTSNIPFGAVQVYDPVFAKQGQVEAQSTRLIHNYFMLKGLEVTRPGGLMAIITTDNFMSTDSNAMFRQYLMERAELVSVVKLPTNLFSEAGTQAGTDLIVLQKNFSSVNKKKLTEREKRFIESRVNDSGIPWNSYFQNTSRILADKISVSTNQYGKPAYEFTYTKGFDQLAQELKSHLINDLKQHFSPILYQSKSSVPLSQASKSQAQLDLFGAFTPAPIERNKPIPYTGSILIDMKEGTLVKQDGQVGRLTKDSNGDFVLSPMNLGKKQQQKVELLLDIRDTYLALVHNERNLQAERADLRLELNRHYDAFRTSFGPFKSKENIDTVKLDTFGRELTTLEIFNQEQKEYVKADIFNAPVHLVKIATTQELSSEDALASSLNRFGKVDLSYMADLTKTSPIQVRNDLANLIFYNPVDDEYQTKEKIGSGNILEKIDQFTLLTPQHEKEVQHSIRLLNTVRPPQVDFDLIDFNLGERWIDPTIYSKFATDLFKTQTQVQYLESLDDFVINFDLTTTQISDVYALQAGNRWYYGADILRFAMLDDLPNLTINTRDAQGNEVKIRDTENIRLVAQKTETVKIEFQTWLQNLQPEEKKELEQSYNKLFNAHVKPVYDGSHMKFPGLNKENLNIKDLYPSQKDAAWMMIQNAGGIADHEVGTGKTNIMITVAHEMKRLGLAAKPMIIGMKANVQQIAEAYLKAYPDAKILAPTEKDFTEKNRENLLDSIANNAWDCVILSHDQFGRIPQSDEMRKRIIEQELDHLEKNTDEFLKNGNSRFSSAYKGLEKRKVSLQASLEKITTELNERRDQVTDFAKMGIDFLQVDESHKFKNLMFTTRHDRVAGLGNPTGSQRALNLLLAVRTIQEKRGNDTGVAFYSGTTISNSLTELYLLFKYLRPKEMERQKISNFDSWLAVYAKKSTDYEYSVTNQLIEKSRFRTFVKVPELASFYGQITDFRTAKMVGVDRPEAVHELINIKPTEQQRQFTNNLIQFADTGDATLLGRPALTKSEESAKMLIATNYSKKAALDMRLIDPDAGDDPNNKVSQAAKRIAQHYHESTAFKGTQMVFCDLGTPSSDKSFNVYDALKGKLVSEYGIPRNEIKFIHDAKTSDQREKLINDVKEGTVRIMMGSTEKMGTGVNAQDRMVAMHHLDVPWKPSDFEQRVGRGARAGNKVARDHFDNKIPNYIYAVEQTLDNFMFNLLQNKATFIRQIKDQNIAVRKIDEGSVDESSGMNYAEYVALLSGNKDLLEKAKIEKRITSMESERSVFIKDHSNMRKAIDGKEQDLLRSENTLRKLEADYHLVSRMGHPFDNLQIVPKRELENIGTRMLVENEKPLAAEKVIAEYQGFRLKVEPDFLGSDRHKWGVVSPNGITYRHNQGNLTATKISTAGEFLNKAVGNLPALLENQQEKVQTLTHDIREFKASVKDGTWPKENELRLLKEQLKAIESRLETSLKPTEDGNGQAPAAREETLQNLNNNLKPIQRTIGRTQ